MLIASNTKSLVYLISLFTLKIYIANSAKTTNELLYRELINLMKNDKNNGVNKVNLNAKQNEKGEHVLNDHGVIIKRIVPHAQQSKSFGYNQDSRTKYKPLVRIHRHYPNEKVDNRLINKLLSNIYKQDSNDGNVYNTGSSLSKDRYLLRPIKFIDKNITGNDILGDIQNYIKDKDDREIRALKYAILNSLEKYLRARTELRSLVYLPPGVEVNFTESKNMDDVFHKGSTHNWGANNSFWTYWTYNKPVYEDNCKGNLIQWGNICIEPPPH